MGKSGGHGDVRGWWKWCGGVGNGNGNGNERVGSKRNEHSHEQNGPHVLRRREQLETVRKRHEQPPQHQYERPAQGGYGQERERGSAS